MAKQFASLYPDLVESSDPVGQQLIADLHAFFHLAVPAGLRASAPLAAHRNPPVRLRWQRTALVAALAAFALVGATYVALPLLQSIWSLDRGLDQVTRAGLARDVNATQTVNGVTVRLQRGYADANRVAVGYMVEFPQSTVADRNAQLGVATLTDERGTVYRGLMSTYAGGSPLGAQVLNFEAPASQIDARDITFTLSIPEMRAGGPGGQGFRGPWVFTFTLPSAAGREIQPALSVSTGELGLTFTRIVVAPSATRFDLRMTRTNSSGAITGSITPLVNGRVLTGAGHCERDGQCFLMTTEPLFDASTLTLDAVLITPDGSGVGGSEGSPVQVRIAGPIVLPLR
jgi:uncharacterized protein DUF4179